MISQPFHPVCARHLSLAWLGSTVLGSSVQILPRTQLFMVVWLT